MLPLGDVDGDGVCDRALVTERLPRFTDSILNDPRAARVCVVSGARGRLAEENAALWDLSAPSGTGRVLSLADDADGDGGPELLLGLVSEGWEQLELRATRDGRVLRRACGEPWIGGEPRRPWVDLRSRPEAASWRVLTAAPVIDMDSDGVRDVAIASWWPIVGFGFAETVLPYDPKEVRPVRVRFLSGRTLAPIGAPLELPVLSPGSTSLEQPASAFTAILRARFLGDLDADGWPELATGGARRPLRVRSCRDGRELRVDPRVVASALRRITCGCSPRCSSPPAPCPRRSAREPLRPAGGPGPDDRAGPGAGAAAGALRRRLGDRADAGGVAGAVPRAVAGERATVESAHCIVTATELVRFDVPPGFASRNQHWKCQVSPACTEIGRVSDNWGRGIEVFI